MSLKPDPIQPVPEETVRVAKTAFRKGNPLLKLRDELGTIFSDEDFADLFPKLGQPGLPPWRLALVTVLQFRENLPDRQAAEAVRARIDWKYLLGLELTDPGFDYSVLCEFRARLLEGSAEERLLGKLLDACHARGLLKARGRQRTDATHVLNRLELVGETLRAALNELATVAPDWLRAAAPRAWYERYARRVEDGRLPRATAEREVYARTVGADGFALLDRLDEPTTPKGLRRLPAVAVLRRVWARHFVRADGAPPGGGVRLRAKEELPPATAPIESPYDPQARFRTRAGTSWTGYVVHLSESCADDSVHLLTHALTTLATVHEARCTAAIHEALVSKGDPPPTTAPIESPYDPQARFRTRAGTSWTGYVVHLSESCADDSVHLLTHALTTLATVHEARCTAAIHEALVSKGVAPGEHLVDAAYVDAELLVRSRAELGIELVGPPRPHPSWQAKLAGGYTIDRFEVDWDKQRVRCPQGRLSSAWSRQIDQTGTPYISVWFRRTDCAACLARPLCTRGKPQARHLKLPLRAEREALKAARERLTTKEGRRLYARRAGIEGTLSQGVRAFGLRHSRYRGLAKTHLQHVATAAAVNLERLAAWFRASPRATTRTSRFAALAA